VWRAYDDDSDEIGRARSQPKVFRGWTLFRALNFSLFLLAQLGCSIVSTSYGYARKWIEHAQVCMYVRTERSMYVVLNFFPLSFRPRATTKGIARQATKLNSLLSLGPPAHRRRSRPMPRRPKW
jgi:hypothetical protein